MRKFLLFMVILLVVMAVTSCSASVPDPVAPLPASAQAVGDDGPVDFDSMTIGGVPVLVLIIALVAVCKDWFGVKGALQLRLLSAGLGVLFGLLHQQTVGWPMDTNGWIVFCVQLLYGVIASGLVDGTRSVLGYISPSERVRM